MNTKKVIVSVFVVLVIALFVAVFVKNTRDQEAASIKGQEHASEVGKTHSNPNSNLNSDRSIYCVYVVDQQNNRVQKFDSNGTYLAQWGGFGLGNNQFVIPDGIGADSAGYIYVSDTRNSINTIISHRVKKFNSFGAPITQWGGYGITPGLFDIPRGIDFDLSGNVYVADMTNNRIQKFNSNGGYLGQWGSSGNGNGLFNRPTDIATDSSGNIYVTDQYNNRIQKFDPSNTFLAQWPLGGNFVHPIGIDTDSSNNVYFARYLNNQVEKDTSVGVQIGWWPVNSPKGLAIDPSDNVYVTDSQNNLVKKFDPNGNLLLQWGGPGTGNSQFNLPEAIAVNSCPPPPPPAFLTLIKNVINDNGGSATILNWNLSATGPTPISGISGSASVTNVLITPGVYTLSETAGPPGYTASTYSCVVNGGPAVTGNSITLAPGDSAVCTITNNDNAPVPSPTTELSGGYRSSLALKQNGTVFAWGTNTVGQVGDGTNIQRNSSVQVHGPGNVGFLSGIIKISGGHSHVLALKNDNTVWTWGGNFNSELGDNTNTDRNFPVQVHGPGNIGFLSGIIDVAGGGDHSLAIKNDNTVWGWGWNFRGELGDGTTTLSATPVQTSSLSSITKISARGHHSLALKNDGTVWAWGENMYGELGDNTVSSTGCYCMTTPVQVHGSGNIGNLSGITAIGSGWDHNLALKNDGTVWAWGANNYGQLGDGTNTDSSTPVQVNFPVGTVITAISVGNYHNLALKNDGTLWGWGWNISGQVGNGTITNTNIPVQVSYITGLINMSGTSGNHSFALKNDGTVWAWGDNQVGQLGRGNLLSSFYPIQITP